jgi:hypothetical protein
MGHRVAFSGLAAVAMIAVLALAVAYVFSFTLVGIAAEVLALAALLVLAGQLIMRLWPRLSDAAVRRRE